MKKNKELKLTGGLAAKVNALLSENKRKSLTLQKDDDREYFLVLEDDGINPPEVAIELRKDGQAIFAVTGQELQQLRSEFK